MKVTVWMYRADKCTGRESYQSCIDHLVFWTDEEIPERERVCACNKRPLSYAVGNCYTAYLFKRRFGFELVPGAPPRKFELTLKETVE